MGANPPDREVAMMSPLRVALLKSRMLAFDLHEVQDGGSMHVVKQLDALLDEGHEVDAFTRAPDLIDRAPTSNPSGVRLWEIGYERSESSEVLQRDLHEGQSFVRGVLASPGFAAAAFDILQLHHWTSGAGLLDCVPESLPIVFTPHLLASEKARIIGIELPAEVAELEHRLLKRADVTVALSRAEQERCLQLGARRVELVPNGVSDTFFEIPASRRPASGMPIRIGSVGRICAQKGTDSFLSAVETLIDAGMDVEVEIVGPPYAEDDFERSIRSRLLDPRLCNRVRLLGAVPHTQLPSIISRWHIYVQPSRYESQCIALLEAMAAGRIVVATDVPAVAEYLNSEMGFLIPSPPRGSDIANAVLSALKMSDWDRVALAAREGARRFRWQNTRQKLADIFAGIAAQSAWGRGQRNSQLSDALRDTAASAANKIVASSVSASVLLLGSAARGLARPGSDVDLLVLSEDSTVAGQTWHFTRGTPVDVRNVPVSRIFDLCSMSRESFAEAVDSDPLPDYLSGAKPLTHIPETLAIALAEIQDRRFERETVALIVIRLLIRTESLFVEALEAARQFALADCQTRINAGAQALLLATLVSEGWVIQGAKRRPEVAVKYSRQSPSVWAACSLLTEAVGIDGITLKSAAHYVALRTKLRTEHLRCLEELNAGAATIEVASRHATGATDYYSAAIASGFIKGCINHMRSLSGIPLMPMVYGKVLNLDPDLGVKAFLDCSDISKSVKNIWLEIIDPHAIDELQGFAERGIALAKQLTEN